MSGIPATGEQIGSYRVLGERGRGGMAVVLEAEHLPTGERRALKMMLPGGRSEEVAHRFRREFQALSRLRHPNVLQVHESGVYEGRPWFAMELLEGRELKGIVEETRDLPPAERYRLAMGVLVQVARALEYIHDQGLVHRDLTPANIMMLPDGSARLMDFGVVKEPGTDLTTVGEVVGTVAYIAPEQIQGGHVDARADLYALGAVFYLLLTGRRPFNARTLAGYMDKHLHRAVRPPRELVPTIPPLADEVCLRLLAKDPDDRYASATHVLLALGEAHGPRHPPDRPHWQPPMVGRIAERARLREALAWLASADPDDPGGGILCVTGPPGSGRSRLMEELVEEARELGLAVSRARNRDLQQPAFSGFRALHADLVRDLGPGPLLLSSLFDGGHHESRLDRWGALAAMAELLSRSPPRLVILEALDQADRGTIEMTEYLVRNLLGQARRPLLIVLTRQPPEEDDPLEALISGESTGVPAQDIALGPISVAAVEELLLTFCAPSAALTPLARRLHAEGEGSPLLIREMVRALFQERVFSPPAQLEGAWTLILDEEAVSQRALPVPGSVRTGILERLAPLSAAGRTLVEALAITRQEIDLDTLLAMAGLPEEEALAGLEEVIEAGLVEERRVGATERFELHRNRVRDVVLAHTPQPQQARLHLRLGNCLERQFRRNTDSVVETLAWHFEQAGLAGKACPYLLAAAEKLQQRALVAEALSCLDRALALEAQAREALPIAEADHRLAELHLARSRVLLHLGRWVEGESEARAADQLANELEDERLQARTAAELACQARRVHKLDEAEQSLRRALQLAERIGDKRLQIVPLYELGAVLWARGDTEAARDFFIQALAGSEAYQDEHSLALGYNGLGLVAFCRGQSAEARRYFEQSMEVSERHGLLDRLAVARTNLVELFHLTGNLKKGMELADRAVAHAREVRHLYGLALGLRYRVLLLTDIGRLAEAIENAEEALRIFRRLRNPEESLFTLVVLIRAQLAAEKEAEAWTTLEEAGLLVADYDSEGFAPMLCAWRARLLARRGQLSEAEAELTQVQGTVGRAWPHQLVRLELNLARAWAALDRRERALGHAEEALRVADSAGYRLYAMRARQIAAHVAPEETIAGRHRKVSEALARSLAAGLAREDAAAFLECQGLVAPSVDTD